MIEQLEQKAVIKSNKKENKKNLNLSKKIDNVLKNINERIKILYGEDYGLSFTSNLGAGTTVEIVLPIINE